MQVDTPTWAQRAGLPAYPELRYVQTLALTASAVALAGYLLVRVAGDPRRAVRAARKATGV